MHPARHHGGDTFAPPMESNPALARELAASAKALRKLARDLIGPADADDLVQETMLRAWRNPPVVGRGLLPWLATVLRNLASNHRRDEQRRLLREGELPQANGSPTPRNPSTNGADEQTALRSVTEALWRLPEPYQSTLTQRYFGGQSPKQIAQRTNTPLATVKSRLQRGLTMLRRAMDQQHDRSWRAALAGAAGLGTSTAAATTTAGLILMAHSSKLITGAAVACVAALLFLSLQSEQAPAPEQPETSGVAMAASTAKATDRDATPTERVQAKQPTEEVEIDLQHSYEYRMLCRVRDRDGLIIRGIKVAIAPRANALNAWHKRTDAAGEVVIDWRGKSPTMRMWVGLSRGFSAQVLQEVEVRAGSTLEVGLLDSAGGASGMCGLAMSASMNCRDCHLSSQQSKLFDLRLRTRQRLHPQSLLSDLLLGDTGARSAGETPLEETSTEVASEMPPPPPSTGITGTVRNRDGEPVGGATVIWSRSPDLPSGRTKSRPNGTFQMPLSAEGTVEVRAGGGPYGIARARVQAVAGKKIKCDLFLDPGRTLTGRVLVPEGHSLDDWRIEYLSQDVSWVDGVDVRPDGTFTLANLPTNSGSILLWSGKSRLPAAIESYAATETEVTFDMRGDRTPAGSLRVQVLQPEDDIERNCSAFAFQADTGRGSVIPRTKDGAFELVGLRAGFYHVVLIGSPFGRLDLGEQWVDGQTLVDLGAHRLPDPGLLRVPDRALADNLELYLRRPDMDICAMRVERRQTEFLVPAGDWLMMWGEQDAPQMRTFSIKASETITVPIAR